MISIFNEFDKEMDLLKLYIDFQSRSYMNQAKLESDQPDSTLKSLTTSKIKQFDFNSHIISIYGAYENFVEQLLVKYLGLLCSSVASYDSLPDDIKKNNLNKTLDILKQIDYRKNKDLKSEILIATLHKNINEDIPAVNIDAFKNHNANFKISIVNSYFSEIGIKDVSNIVKNYEPLNSYIKGNIPDASSKPNKVIFEKLEYICEVRNDIAHGVRSIDLIDKSILFEHIDYMKIYCNSLYELINDKYLEKLYVQIKEEVTVINIYASSILCFQSEGKIINRNSKILVKSDNHTPNYFLANILDIQHSSVSIDSTDQGKDIQIGVSLDKKIKSTMSFSLFL